MSTPPPDPKDIYTTLSEETGLSRPIVKTLCFTFLYGPENPKENETTLDFLRRKLSL